MGNLDIWEKVRNVPTTAIKPITGGRLKGMTDINPMWRMKVLTEQFGPCGIGWKYEIVEKRLESGSKEQIAAFVDINLYVKHEGEWSAAIPGTGGSSFVAAESGGLYTNDECFKMALTDAISVSCKALGFGADVYWDKDKTKYSQTDREQGEPTPAPPTGKAATGVLECSQCKSGINAAVKTFSEKKFGKPLCMECQKKHAQSDT